MLTPPQNTPRTMPLDINAFREFKGGNPEEIRESQRRRFKDPATVDEIIALDEAWRNQTGQLDHMKKAKGKLSKAIGLKKRAKENADAEMAESKEMSVSIAAAETALAEAELRVTKALRKIGNIVHGSVPVSNDEEKDNEVVVRWGGHDAANPFPKPSPCRHHHELLAMIGGYEPERGVRVAGHRGYFLRDNGLALSMALQNYAIQFLRRKGYTSLQPPYFMNKSVMAGVAQLEEFDEALYHVSGEGSDEKYVEAKGREEHGERGTGGGERERGKGSPKGGYGACVGRCVGGLGNLRAGVAQSATEAEWVGGWQCQHHPPAVHVVLGRRALPPVLSVRSDLQYSARPYICALSRTCWSGFALSSPLSLVAHSLTLSSLLYPAPTHSLPLTRRAAPSSLAPLVPPPLTGT